MKKAFLFVAIVAWVSVAATARAQDKGQLGFTAAVNAGAGEGAGSIGALYHLSKSVALRPSFGYSRSKADTVFYSSGMGDPARDSGSTYARWNVGLAGLFYLSRKDELSTYVGGSAAYGKTKTTIQDDRVPMGSGRGASLRQENDGIILQAFLGMQYAVAKRFGLYGELGLRYYESWGEGSLEPNRDASSFTTYGAGLGAIFYLR